MSRGLESRVKKMLEEEFLIPSSYIRFPSKGVKLSVEFIWKDKRETIPLRGLKSASDDVLRDKFYKVMFDDTIH